MQKARGHACHLRDLALPQLVGYTVSGTFHFPNGGAFHHFLHSTSFTIGRQGVFSLRRWFLLDSYRFAYPVVLGVPIKKFATAFAHGTFTRSGLLFPETLS